MFYIFLLVLLWISFVSGANITAMETNEPTEIWGKEKPLEKFINHSKRMISHWNAINQLNGEFLEEPPHTETALRPDGITFKKDGNSYISNQEEIVDRDISFITDTAGLYGYRYSEDRTLSLYALENIENPQKIRTIKDCPFGKKVDPSDIRSLGGFLFLQKKKSIALFEKGMSEVYYKDLPDTALLKHAGETFIIPQCAKKIYKNFTKEDTKGATPKLFGVPCAIDSQEFLLLFCKPTYYILRQDGAAIRLRCAATTDPLYSLFEKKIFFIKASQDTEWKRGTLCTFDGTTVKKVCIIRKDCREAYLIFINKKLTIYTNSGFGSQFGKITAQNDLDKKAILKVIHTIQTKSNADGAEKFDSSQFHSGFLQPSLKELRRKCKPSFFREKYKTEDLLTEEDSKELHQKVMEISTVYYIEQAIPGFFDTSFHTLTGVWFEENKLSGMRSYLKQVYTVVEYIKKYPQQEILRTALKKEFILRYSAYKEHWSEEKMAEYSRFLNNSKTMALTKYGEKHARMIKALFFLFYPPLISMITIKPETLSLPVLSIIYKKGAIHSHAQSYSNYWLLLGTTQESLLKEEDLFLD